MSKLEKHISITPEEYLESEKYSTVKHEYVAGHVYAMVGASESHNLIAGSLYSALRAHLRGSACRVFMSDMKVRIADTFYYPDVMVTCDKTDTEPYYKSRPVLIAEVLSTTTESRDTLEKRVAYQSLRSLQEYVVVSQDKPEVRIYRRTDMDWELEICTEEDLVKLTSIGLEVPVENLFEDVWR